MDIPESTAQAVANQLRSQFNDFTSSDILMRKRARMALRVATPLISAQALEEAARSFSESTPEGEYASTPEQVITWMREYAELYRGNA